MFRFEKLDVWPEAIALSDRVYEATRRSAVSISANIAEGSGHGTDPECRRFIEIASGSLMETVSHLTIASRQRFLSEPDFRDLDDHCERIEKMLRSLRNRLIATNK